jgi:hypothetical protein
MSQKIEITGDDPAYKIILTGKDLGIFEAASRDSSVQGKTGEALAAAILEVAKKDVFGVERFKRNEAGEYEKNDGPNGEAAFMEFNQGGILVQLAHLKDGALNDGPKGAAAIQEFFDDGKLLKAQHCREGVLNDTPGGEAAVQEFNEKGGLIFAVRYRDGALNDGPKGEPAIQEFDADGLLIRAERYQDDILVRKLNDWEIASYVAALHREQAIQTITSAAPGLRVL